MTSDETTIYQTQSVSRVHQSEMRQWRAAGREGTSGGLPVVESVTCGPRHYYVRLGAPSPLADSEFKSLAAGRPGR